jgi:hypothetical protein
MRATVFQADVRSRSTTRRHRLPVLLAVWTVIATFTQLPSAAAETGGAGQVEEAPVYIKAGDRPLPVHAYEINPGPAP